MVQQQLVEFCRHGFGFGQVGEADGAPRHLVLVGRPDPAAGGADLAVSPRRLARPVDRPVQRQDQRDVLGDPQRVRRHAQPLAAHLLDLGQQRLGVHHDAVADDAELAAHQPGGQ